MPTDVSAEDRYRLLACPVMSAYATSELPKWLLVTRREVLTVVDVNVTEYTWL
jgi:hypothetical protein